MLCEYCKINKATVFIQQKKENQTTELHLCAGCAMEHGYFKGEFGLPVRDDVPGLTEEQACSVCGQTLKEIRKHRRAGCPQCYIEFADEITGLLSEEGLEKPYIGSLPLELRDGHSVLDDRTLLQTRLRESVESEDYEKAAVYRDRLRALDEADE